MLGSVLSLPVQEPVIMQASLVIPILFLFSDLFWLIHFFICLFIFVFNFGKNQLNWFPKTVGGHGLWFENHALGCGPSEAVLGSESKGENGSLWPSLEPSPSAFFSAKAPYSFVPQQAFWPNRRKL